MVEGLEEMEEGFEDADNEVLEEVEFLEGDGRDRFTCILASREAKHSQRHVLFKTRCTINKKVCESL